MTLLDDNLESVAGLGRVLYFGFRRPLNQAALKAALRSIRPERVGLISRSDFLGELKDEFLSARNGFRACNFETNNFTAFPPRAIIEAMWRHEPEALRMYERIFRGVSAGQSFKVRRELYLQHMTYAYGLLADGGYESVVFSEIPHHPFAYVLHSVARLMGLDVRFFAQFQIKDSFVIAGGIPEMFDTIGDEHDRQRKAGDVPELSERMQLEAGRRSGDYMPFYMGVSDLTLRRRLYARSKKYFRADDRLRVGRKVRNALAYRRARREMPAPGEHFIYFPLHLQPEATTSPMGGVFVDQYLALEMLVRALPAGWKVVVKENPIQEFAKRDIGFYQHLGELEAVHLVSRKTSTFDLIERCAAVATITGTAGWEALFKGKPAIVFGYAFYRDAPGVIAVESAEELGVELGRIADGSFQTPTRGGLESFLAAVQQSAHRGIVDEAYLRDCQIPFDDLVESFTTVLVEHLAGRAAPVR